MNVGTAQGRLDKHILFWLIKKAGLDTCYRCGQTIDRIEDLSTDHKEPWLDVDPALFWDVENNIAFSHRSCNYRAARPTGWATAERLNEIRIDRHRDAPEGQAWCFGHKLYLARDQFGKNKYFPSGVQRFCIECRAAGK